MAMKTSELIKALAKCDWWTAPALTHDGELLIVTGRSGLMEALPTGDFPYCLHVNWDYTPAAQGLPDTATSQLMEQAHDALLSTFDADPVAVLTGIYTGAGQRNWVFYARSLPLFGKKLNEALSSIEQALPITFEAEEDADWEEYRQMVELEVRSTDA